MSGAEGSEGASGREPAGQHRGGGRGGCRGWSCAPKPHSGPRIAIRAALHLLPLAEEQGIRGFCSVPLLLRDEVTGVLSVGTRSDRDFTAEELEVLCAFADQAALAVEKASLLAAQTEEAEVTRSLLEAIANTSSSMLDLPALLAGLATSVQSVLGCDFCVISLDDDAGGASCRSIRRISRSGFWPQWKDKGC